MSESREAYEGERGGRTYKRFVTSRDPSQCWEKGLKELLPRYCYDRTTLSHNPKIITKLLWREYTQSKSKRNKMKRLTLCATILERGCLYHMSAERGSKVCSVA